MRSINEIVEGLNAILCGIAEEGALNNEIIKEWSSIMLDYRVWEECNK